MVELSNDTVQSAGLNELVSSVSKAMGEDKGAIALVDPTAEQLGLAYAACMKTDREDGLYSTVVCTRSNEALGLVYSSKVCLYQLFLRLFLPSSFSDLVMLRIDFILF